MLNVWKWLSVFFLILSLPACSGMHKNVSVNENLKETLKSNQARAAIFLDRQGNIVAADSEGKSFHICTIKPGRNQCQGLKRGSEILNIETLTVIESKVNPNCITIVDGNGFAHERCW